MQMKLFLNLTSKDQYTHRDWDHGIKPLPYFLLHLKITVTAGAWRGTRRFYVYCIVLMIISTTCNVQRTLGKKCKSGVLEEKFKSDYGYFQHRDGRCLLMGCTNHTWVERNATESHLDVLLQPKIHAWGMMSTSSMVYIHQTKMENKKSDGIPQYWLTLP